MKNLAALFLAFCAFFYSQFALAGAVGPFIGNLSSTGSMVYFGSNAYSKAQAAMGVGKRWNPDVLASSGLGVSVAQKIALPVGAGAANATLSGLITPVSVLATAGAILGSPAVAVVSSLVLLPGVLDWLLAGDLRPSSSGTLEVGTSSPDSCAANCYEYWIAGYYHEKTKDKVCSAWAADLGSTGTITDGICLRYTGSSYQGTANIVVVPISPYGSSEKVWTPATSNDITQRLSGVPVSVALINSLLDAGYTFPLDSPSVTGPASVTGPSTTSSTTSTSSPTTANPAGESITTNTTSTPVSNQTYSNTTNPATGQPAPTVTSTTTVTTTTTVINNTTNVTNTTVKTDTAPDKATADEVKKQEDFTFQDKEFPDVPKLYERKYPDGLVGIWNTKIAAIKAAPLFTLVGQLMPSLPSSGQCPAFMIPVNFGKWGEYGNLDFSPPCFVWDFGKVIIIVSALLLSRRLIFGG